MDKKQRVVFTALCLPIAAAAGYVVLRWGVLSLLPFLPAWAAAAAGEPLLRFLRRRLKLKRSFLAAVLTLLAVAVTVGGLWACIGALWHQVTDLLSRAPQLLATLPTLYQQIAARLESFRVTLPPETQQAAQEALTALGAALGDGARALSASLLESVTRLVGQLPGLLVGCITAVMALFFTMSHYPQLRAFLLRQIPAQHLLKLRAVKEGALYAVAKWLRAQLLLFMLTFSQLLAGFLLLRRDYALLLAALIALLDALPLFGAGLVLLPWAALLALLGDTVTALGMAALYAVVWLVRSFSEPKLLGQSGDLPPLPSLMAIYLGFRLFGVVGMLLGPLVLLLVKELHDRGLIRLWK